MGVTLTLAPDARPEIVLLPAGPGLGTLADAAAAGAVAAAPRAPGRARRPGPGRRRGDARGGRGAAGGARGRRAGAPLGRAPRFDRTALAAFGADPAAALAARGAALGAGGLTLLMEAVQPLLGTVPGRAVTTAGGALGITAGPVTVRWPRGRRG